MADSTTQGDVEAAYEPLTEEEPAVVAPSARKASFEDDPEEVEAKLEVVEPAMTKSAMIKTTSIKLWGSSLKACRSLPGVESAAFVCGVGYVVLALLLMLQSPSLLALVVNALLILFGLVVCCVERPHWRATRVIQLKVFDWVKLMARAWGRAVVYLVVAVVALAMAEQQFVAVVIPAVMQVPVALVMLVVSRVAAFKYARMARFLLEEVAGGEKDLAAVIGGKFDEYAQVDDGRMGEEAIRAWATDSGRTLSKAEYHAIQAFLDESCTGAVSKADFVKRIAHDARPRWL